MLNAFFTRFVDIIGSFVLLFFTLPILLMVILAIKISSPGPVLFKQKRVGKNGEVFNIFKFRSMRIDSEQVLKSDSTLYNKYIENSYKLDPSEDPRITKIGEFLRKTSLDELPQLLNVLKGEMSLVGPRPVIQDELKEYRDVVEKFLSVKPGITGYWQVSGRSNVGYPERVDIELYYVERKNIFFDIFILIKTLKVVMKRQGAY